MNIDGQINSFLLSLHFLLLAAKIMFLYIIANRFTLDKTPKCNNMLLFDSKSMTLFLYTIVFTSFEIYFIYSYFVDINIYSYEIMAIIDQILLTITFIWVVKDEISNKRT